MKKVKRAIIKRSILKNTDGQIPATLNTAKKTCCKCVTSKQRDVSGKDHQIAITTSLPCRQSTYEVTLSYGAPNFRDRVSTFT
jgi:hypothetical protein